MYSLKFRMYSPKFIMCTFIFRMYINIFRMYKYAKMLIFTLKRKTLWEEFINVKGVGS